MSLSVDQTAKQLQKEFEAHECCSTVDVCNCQFSYICAECRERRVTLGEEIASGQIVGICFECWAKSEGLEGVGAFYGEPNPTFTEEDLAGIFDL